MSSTSIQPTRLALFDIDGTLLTSAGVATATFSQVLAEVAGRPVPADGYSMAGKTDPQIVRDLLRRAGLLPQAIDGMVPRVLDRYLERFPAALAASPRPRLFPGVRDLLAHLAALPHVLVGLLTGNVERGAAIKLGHFGLGDRFRVGAYGSDSEDRRALVEVAVRRAEALTGRRFAARDVVVIGDTPLDIDCGRAAGALTVAVATGPYSTDDLEAHHPDALFRDFAEVERVAEVIAGAAPAAPAHRGAGR